MISVVLCTYNGEKYLEQQLLSILNQTRLPDEIILSDDGSGDQTLAIAHRVLDSTRTTDIRVSVLTRGSPLGAAGNFSAALAEATGDLIALSDQDDVWEPDKLEVLTEVFSTHPDVLLVHTDATLIDASGRTTGTLMATLNLTGGERKALLARRGLETLLRRNVVTGATVMLRGSLLQQALPIPHGWVHDEWLALVAALQGGLFFDERPLLRYRIHRDNAIGASALTAAQISVRLGQTRSDFFGLKNLRNQAISFVLEKNPSWLPEAHRRDLVAKLEHDSWRGSLPKNRLVRVFPVLQRVFSGHYRRFARGHLDVVRDLVQRP
jgi:glycosyltransferase involved in cell wall biosynthesis